MCLATLKDEAVVEGCNCLVQISMNGQSGVINIPAITTQCEENELVAVVSSKLQETLNNYRNKNG